MVAGPERHQELYRLQRKELSVAQYVQIVLLLTALRHIAAKQARAPNLLFDRIINEKAEGLRQALDDLIASEDVQVPFEVLEALHMLAEQTFRVPTASLESLAKLVLQSSIFEWSDAHIHHWLASLRRFERDWHMSMTVGGYPYEEWAQFLGELFVLSHGQDGLVGSVSDEVRCLEVYEPHAVGPALADAIVSRFGSARLQYVCAPKDSLFLAISTVYQWLGLESEAMLVTADMSLERTFDVILTVVDESQKSVKLSRPEQLTVLLNSTVQKLKADGVGLLVVPNRMLTVRPGFYRTQEAVILEQLVQQGLIESILGLPQRKKAEQSMSVVIVRKRPLEKEKLHLVSIADARDTREVFERVLQLYASRAEATADDETQLHSRWVARNTFVANRDAGRSNLNLNPDDYFLQNHPLERELELMGAQMLKHYADVKRGCNWPDSASADGDRLSRTYLAIGLSDVQEDTIRFEALKPIVIHAPDFVDERFFATKFEPEFTVRNGDLLVSTRGVTVKTTIVANYETHLLPHPVVMSNHFIRIRLLDHAPFDVHYVKFFLESPVGAKLLKMFQQTGGSQPLISHRQLMSMRVPVPQLTEQQMDALFVSLSDGQRQLHAAEARFEALKQASYRKFFSESLLACSQK